MYYPVYVEHLNRCVIYIKAYSSLKKVLHVAKLVHVSTTQSNGYACSVTYSSHSSFPSPLPSTSLLSPFERSHFTLSYPFDLLTSFSLPATLLTPSCSCLFDRYPFLLLPRSVALCVQLIDRATQKISNQKRQQECEYEEEEEGSREE